MLTAEEYRQSLRDGRRTFIDGRRVDDITQEPVFRSAIESIGRGYERFYSPEPGAYHPMYDVPTSVAELQQRVANVNATDDISAALAAVVLALTTSAPEIAKSNPARRENIDAFVDECRRKDIRVCEAITDAKGDRSLAPSKQVDPDAYLHVVDRSSDGIVVRGCKLHITAASVVHEVVVLPTKQMKAGEEDYAVAFAVPLATPGLSVVNATYAPRHDDDRHFPLSRVRSSPDGFVIFDDVFVPAERVFLDGEVEHSARLAHTLGLWERAGSVAASAHDADLLVGLAQLIAEANGLERVSHIRDKITEMIVYATMIRAGLEAALANATVSDGLVRPDALYTNAAKYYAGIHYHEMTRNLQDIAGGLVMTSPTVGDWENREIGHLVAKYLQGGRSVPAEARMRLFHAIRDVTADALGGWKQVTKVLAGGGLYAQRMITRKHYDMEAAKAIAREAAGIEDLA